MVQCSTQARNLSRLIWIHVALPPTNDTTGKTPMTDITTLQLHRRKRDTLKLILAFVYAVKHYLREEDGLQWDDYKGVIPESFMRTYSRRQSRRSSVSLGYNATSEHGSTSSGNSRSGSPSREASTDGSLPRVTTKRVRVKRSLDKVPTARTPLVAGEHSTIVFQDYADASIPFPLVCVE